MIGGYASETNYNNNKYEEGHALNSFKGKLTKSFAIAGAWYPTFFDTNYSNRLNQIKTSLKSAKDGTRVIIWLGVNDLGNSYYYSNGKPINQTSGTPELKAAEYVNQIKNLAKAYPKLEFYYVSVTAVNEKIFSGKITNNKIDKFNSKLSSEIKNAKLSNLIYIDINSELKSKVISNNPVVTWDGLHYSPNDFAFYKTISDLIYKKVSQASSKITPASPTKKAMYGDANYDDKIDSSDITIIKKLIKNGSVSKTVENNKYAQLDVDGDGMITSVDLECIQLKVNGKIKVFLIKASEEDFNLDGKEFSVDDAKSIYDWCFDSSNIGKHNSERQITINGTKISSELTWKIMKRYVAFYKNRRNVSSCSYKDLYNYYIGWTKSKGNSTGAYTFKK